MEPCIFCKIIKGEIPAAKVYEDKDVFSFLDIMPANKGHCLIIPKKHYESLIEIPDDDLSAIIKAAKKIAKALSLSMGNDAYNIVMNNGKEAGQLVAHAHIHLIPRFKGDRLRLSWSHKKYSNKEIDKFSEKIKKFL
jgi:histidine triad (HIT) family protein|tara:strand:+ start:347 stop:757 length:411 start_codon:yes stop_codon:yes gene_type:complete